MADGSSRIVIACFSCTGDEPDELSFDVSAGPTAWLLTCWLPPRTHAAEGSQKGDLIQLVQKDDAQQWWEGFLLRDVSWTRCALTLQR